MGLVAGGGADEVRFGATEQHECRVDPMEPKIAHRAATADRGIEQPWHTIDPVVLQRPHR